MTRDQKCRCTPMYAGNQLLDVYLCDSCEAERLTAPGRDLELPAFLERFLESDFYRHGFHWVFIAYVACIIAAGWCLLHS